MDAPASYNRAMKLKASILASEVDLNTPEGKDELILSAIEWDNSIRTPLTNLFIRRHFWPEIQRLTGVDLDYVLDIAEAHEHHKKRTKHDELLSEGLSRAANALEQGAPAQAKEIINTALIAAENALLERAYIPISDTSDMLSSLRKDLQLTQGVKFTGLTQGTIPELDDATEGHQGLILVAAKSGEGKTMLVLQNMLDIVATHDDVCALFISLDMRKERILTRMLTNRVHLPINTVRKGTGPTGWTDAEKVKIEEGFSTLKTLGKRIRVVDRFNFPVATRGNILKEMNRLMEASNTNHCLVAVDFLGLLPVPDSVKDPDDWRIKEMQDLRDEMNGDPLICITESRKNDPGENRGSADNVKGTGRTVYLADLVMTLTPWRNEDLLLCYNITEDGFPNLRAETEPWKGSRDEKDARANRIRKALARRGEAPVMLKIDKARDGATRTEIDLINRFTENRFTSLPPHARKPSNPDDSNTQRA